MKDKVKKCEWANCEQLGNMECGACGEVWYCSRDHQRLNWENHYPDCKSFKTKHSETAGNFLVASRKIKAGSRIITDDPLAIGPLMSSELTCLTCLEEIVEEDFTKCPDCHWPMCSTTCYLSKKHDEECNVLSDDSKHWAVPSSHGSTPRYDLILIIRCLMLKKQNKDKFQILMSMASHHEEMTKLKDPFHLTAVRFLTEVWKFPLEEVNQIRGAIVCNAFEVRNSAGNMVRAMYPNLRIFNHSCLPNVQLSATLDGKMDAKAAVDIDKNTELVITYPGTSQPIWDRQEYLKKIHHFLCNCKRCSDPTELGTYFSTPRCPICKDEFQTRTVTNVWKCRKCNTQSDQEELQQEIDDWLFRLEMNDFFGTGAPNKISSGLYKIEKEFHRSHYVYMKACQMGLRKLKSDKSWPALRLKREMWTDILKIFDSLEPGLTRHRGMIFFELANVLFTMAEEGEDDIDFSKAQLENYKRESKQYYLKSYEILHLEPKGTIEWELAALIQRKMYDSM